MTDILPGQIIWPIIAILVSLSSIGGFVLSAYKTSRRDPPLPEELAKEYVRKPELSTAVEILNSRISREIGMLRDSFESQGRKIDTLIQTTNHIAMNTERTLGRIEGKISKLKCEKDCDEG